MESVFAMRVALACHSFGTGAARRSLADKVRVLQRAERAVAGAESPNGVVAASITTTVGGTATSIAIAGRGVPTGSSSGGHTPTGSSFFLLHALEDRQTAHQTSNLCSGRGMFGSSNAAQGNGMVEAGVGAGRNG